MSTLEFTALPFQHRHVCHCSYPLHHRHGMGLQQHQRQPVHRYFGDTFFDTILSILNGLFPVPIVNDYGSSVPILIGLGALALVLVALTRGRLGYQPYREEVPDPATVRSAASHTVTPLR